jgi:predicted anti-sigma-YlaC factor YlaD
MKIEEISCREVMNHICENLAEDLNSERCRRIKSHLEECEDCRHYFDSIEKTIDFYKKYEVDISPECHKRLIDFLGLK